MGSINSPTCNIQGCTEDGTLLHDLIYRDGNDGVGLRLLQGLQLQLQLLNLVLLLPSVWNMVTQVQRLLCQ